MTSLLITNDDGIDSPALVPFAHAVERLGAVTVAAPSGERSWIGKAISKVGTIPTDTVARDGLEMWSVGGTPADCVQIASFGLLEAKPDLVLSGINIGSNKGSAFASGSGTLGAALEAANIGVGGIAFSAMSVGDWEQWVEWVETEDALEMWTRLAGVAADIASGILATGFPTGVDVLSVNMPADADLTTPRRITTLGRTRYGSLFAGNGSGAYSHSFDGILHTEGDLAGSDIEVLDEGMISITPIRFASTAPLSDSFRRVLET
ncbi:MAG: 5'/3'-nucleotidase SurE [Acidimicrobiia bacterium]|nr:5'/3'-nucleotidase SurE [Acidimicrobiia bacterium]